MINYKYQLHRLVCCCFLLLSTQAFSIDYTTDDVATWQTATWTPAGIPGAGDNVTLLPGAEIIVDQNQSCNNLVIEDDGTYTTLTINTGNTLTVNGTFDMDDTGNDSWIDIYIDGTLQIDGFTTVRTSTGNTGALWSLVISSNGLLDLNTTSTNRTRFWMMQASGEFTLDCGGPIDAEGDLYFLTRNGGIATITIDDNITLSCRDWYQYVRSSGSTITTNINGGIIDAEDEIKFDITGASQADNVIDMGKTGTPEIYCNRLTNPTEGTLTNLAGASFASNFTFDITNAALVIPSDANIIFHNVIIENNVDATIGGNLPAAQLLGDLEIKTGGTFGNAGFTLDVTDDIIHSGDDFTLSGATTANDFTNSGLLTQSSALALTGNYNNSSTSTQSALLTIGGDFTNSGTQDAGANISVSGDFTNNGTFTQNTNKVTLSGAAAQVIGGTTTTDFYDLEINNSSGGVSLSNDINIAESGTLTLTSGTLTTTGQTMTLLSSVSGTARIGEVTGGAISGDFTIQRFISSTPNWRILASPVAGTTISDWNTEIPMSCIGGAAHTSPHFTSVYTYNETDLGTYDVGYSAGDDPGPAGVSLTDGISSGLGYMAYVGTCPPPGPCATITADLTGTLVTGDQTLTVNFTSSAGDDHDGWNMLGNPFPSDISWDAVGPTGGVTGIAYVYDAASESYMELNQALPGDRDAIPSHQGFWAKASGSAGTIVIEEGDKTTDANNFLKNSTNPPGFKLALSGNGFTDDVEVFFMDNTSDAYDPMVDALKLYSYSYYLANFSIVSSDSKELAQNFLPNFDQDYSLPLNINWIWPGVSSNFTISSTDFSGIPESSCIILEDTATGTFTDLRLDTAYSFTMTPDTGLSPRFILHIGSQLDITATDETCPGNADGSIIALGNGSGPFDYEWEDESGNIIQDTYDVIGPDTLENLGAGTYTVTIYNNSLCGEGSRTIEILALEGMALSTSVQDVECSGDIDGEASVNPNGGTSPFAYLWDAAAGNQTTATAVGLGAGTYSVSVTDANNCIESETATVSEPTLMTPDFTSGADTAFLSEGGVVYFTNTSVGAASYYWDFGDGSTTTDVSPWNLYNSAGTYTVMLVAFDGISCYDTAYHDVVVIDEPVSLNDIVQFHPNVRFMQDQSGVMVYLDFPGSTMISLNVYNQLGQQVIANNSFTATKNMVKVNLSNEPKGLYFIEVNTPKDRITKKVYF